MATIALTAAYNQVANTSIGAAWIKVLENSPLLYTITNNPLVPNDAYYDYPYSTLISVDPNFHPDISVNSACGRERSSTAVILAHEIAHAATGVLDKGPGRMSNVNWNENMIRPQLGLPLRTAYGPPPPFAW
jgi:hypothetical protein